MSHLLLFHGPESLGAENDVGGLSSGSMRVTEQNGPSPGTAQVGAV